MGTAQAVAGGLGEQRRLFDRIGSRLEDVGARFPLVNSLLGAIRRKRSKARALSSARLPCVLLPPHAAWQGAYWPGKVCFKAGLHLACCCLVLRLNQVVYAEQLASLSCLRIRDELRPAALVICSADG